MSTTQAVGGTLELYGQGYATPTFRSLVEGIAEKDYRVLGLSADDYRVIKTEEI